MKKKILKQSFQKKLGDIVYHAEIKSIMIEITLKNIMKRIQRQLKLKH